MADESLEGLAKVDERKLSPKGREALAEVKGELLAAKTPETWMEWTREKVWTAMKWVGIGTGIAAVGAVAAGAGGVLGFTYGTEKAAEVAPEVMVGVASREVDERLKELSEFWETVKPLLLSGVGQVGEFLEELKKKGSSLEGIQTGAMALYNGFKNDGVEWIATGDTSLDQTVVEIAKAVEADPDLAPKWKAIMATYGKLKAKQAELPALSARLTSVTPEDRAQIESDVKREMKEAVLKDLPWASSPSEQ